VFIRSSAKSTIIYGPDGQVSGPPDYKWIDLSRNKPKVLVQGDPRRTSAKSATVKIPVVEVKARKRVSEPVRGVQLSVIMICAAKPQERSAAKVRLGEAKALLQRGRDFGDTARELSEDEISKARDGALDLLSKRELTERYGSGVATTLLNMDVGQLKIVELQSGAALFLKTEDREP
jgi:hypothetical protein